MLTLPHIPRPATFRHRRITTPQGMVSVLNMLLLLVLFSLVIQVSYSIAAGPGMQLPASQGACYRTPVDINLTIHLDAQNRLSLSASDPQVQAAMIQQVAARHHVTFSAEQRQRLPHLPFLSEDIQRLPAWLSASTAGQPQQARGISATLGNDQFSEYLAVGLTANQALLGLRGYLRFRADQRLSTAQVKRVFHLLEQQGIKRIMLVTETRQSLKVIHLPNGHTRYTYF